MHKHPQSKTFADRLERCLEFRRPWSGPVYRSASPRYANRDDFLTGAGAKSGGARWNPPGSFATVYTSLDPDTAVLEALAHHGYFGLPPEEALPRVLAAARVVLQQVLDLTDPEVRRTMRVSQIALLEEDWRATNRGGQEALTQAIGRLAWEAEWEALLVPSAAADGRKKNLIIFPGNLVPPASYLLIVNRDQLPPRPAD